MVNGAIAISPHPIRPAVLNGKVLTVVGTQNAVRAIHYTQDAKLVKSQGLQWAFRISSVRPITTGRGWFATCLIYADPNEAESRGAPSATRHSATL